MTMFPVPAGFDVVGLVPEAITIDRAKDCA